VSPHKKPSSANDTRLQFRFLRGRGAVAAMVRSSTRRRLRLSLLVHYVQSRAVGARSNRVRLPVGSARISQRWPRRFVPHATSDDNLCQYKIGERRLPAACARIPARTSLSSGCAGQAGTRTRPIMACMPRVPLTPPHLEGQMSMSVQLDAVIIAGPGPPKWWVGMDAAKTAPSFRTT
jgi:hypothetical protein